MDHTTDSSYLGDSTRASLGMTTVDYSSNNIMVSNGNRTSLNGISLNGTSHHYTNGTTHAYSNSYANGTEDEQLEEDDEEITPAELIEKLQNVLFWKLCHF
jgi:hypothetical protein